MTQATLLRRGVSKLGLVLVVCLVAVIPAEGAGPARNGLIVYTGVTSENATPEIYAYPILGGSRVNISRHLEADRYPAVSPDGTKIVFMRSEVDLTTQDFDEDWFVARSGGSDQRPLALKVPYGTRFRWAPDSRHVAGAIQDPDGSFVVVVDTETSATQRIGPGHGPQWSPRHTTVAYVGFDGRLYVAVLGDLPIRAVAEGVQEFRWSPDGTRIAYAGGSGSVAAVDVATGATAKLAPAVFGSEQIRWSPDGTRIYFRSGYEKFVFVPSDGGVVQTFARADGQGQIEVSPSGVHIALVQAGRLSLRTPDGAVVRDLGAGLNPSWSPTGSHLAFVRDGGLLVAEVASGIVRVLADRKTDTVWQAPAFREPPVWRPDGTAVIASSVAGSIRTGLFVTEADGTGTRALPSPHSNEDDPAWSPDGRSIAFTSYGVTPTVMVGDDQLGHLRVIAERGSEPAWSPDGSQVAYVGESKPRYSLSPFVGSGIFVVGADGRGRRRITRGKDRSPAWSPDGTTIAFARATRYGTGLYLRRLAGGAASLVFDAGSVGENDEPGEVVSISWSPTDSSRLAFRLTSFVPEKYYSPDEDEVIVIDTRGRHWPRKVVSRMKAGTSIAWSPDGRFLLHGSNVDEQPLGEVPRLTDSHFRITRPDGRPVGSLTVPQRASSPSWQPLCTRSGSGRGDRIRGTSGADVQCGLGGNDVITGGDGKDRIFGQGGNDRIDARDGIFDVIGCGEGRDTVVADRIDLVGVDCERVRRS